MILEVSSNLDDSVILQQELWEERLVGGFIAEAQLEVGSVRRSDYGEQYKLNSLN